MIILNGIGVFKDISFGTICISKEAGAGAEKRSIKDCALECDRYKSAKKEAIKQIRGLYEKSLKDFGADEAEIFATHEMMIKDQDYENTILEIINTNKVNAEYAVWEASRRFAEVLENMDDSYMSLRAMDIRDISSRLINILCGEQLLQEKIESGTIIASRDLTPSKVSELGRSKVKGIILQEGAVCSHASIISRVLKIPMIVSLDGPILDEYDKMEVIIDSISGTVYIDPDDATVKIMTEKKKQNDRRLQLLKCLKGKENITKDGKKIDIYANINYPHECDEAIENDSSGIGLFRSEFLYLNQDSYPDEEEQFKVYKSIIQKMNGKKVIIRTLDIGSDKNADYFGIPKEVNPAMGCRGARVYFDRPEVFMTQLRAIYRASAFGNAAIMFPMIISLKEIQKIKKYIEVVKNGLKNRGVEFNENLPLGVMIETPAAAMISDEIAKEVDFFSIGTNDLTQYTLAIDRQNSKVNKMFDSHHKAILRLIKIIVDNAHQNGIWVGICGELASDESLVSTFLSMGVDELSVSPSMVLEIRKKVCEIDVSQVKQEIIANL